MSRGGYKRHRTAKHESEQSQNPTNETPSILSEIVNNAVKHVKESEVYADSL